MTKTKSTILLVVILVLVLFFTVAAVLPKITIGKYDYNSPLQHLKKGADISEGYYAGFELSRPDDISDEDFQEDIDETLAIMTARLADFNVRNSIISSTGDIITLRTDKMDTITSIGTIASMRGYFVLAMRDAKSGESDVNNPTLTNVHCTSYKLKYSSEGPYYYLQITLNADGVAALKKATASATSSATVTGDFYVDGKVYESDAFTADSVYGLSYINIRAADDSTLKVLESVLGNGMMPLAMTIVKTDSFMNNAQPMLGDNAALWCVLLVGVAAIAFIVAVIVKHGLFGFAASVSFVIELLLIAYISAYGYLPAFDVASTIAVIAVIGVFALSTFSFFGRLASLPIDAAEQNDEKKLVILYGRARRQTTRSIINIHAIGILVSIVLWILTPGVMKSFAVVLCYGLALSLLCNLFVTSLLSRLFIAANSNLACYRLNKRNDNTPAKEAK